MNKINLIAICFFSVSVFGMTFDSKVPEDIKNQMLDDMKFVETIAGSPGTKLHQEIFGSVYGKDYVDFLNDRVKSVGVSTCGNPNAVACVIPFLSSSKMWITKNYIKFSHPQIARLSVVFHEARHTETEHGNWPHAKCPTPFLDAEGKEKVSIWTGAKLAGEPACDETEYGSYGSSVILLKNISANCESCTEKVKLDAGIYGDDQLGRIIDKDAIESITGDAA